MFTGLEQLELKALARLLRPRLLVPDELVIRKGDRGRGMFFISSGAVEVVLPHERVRLGSGDFFGEMALLDHGRAIPTWSRSATAGCWSWAAEFPPLPAPNIRAPGPKSIEFQGASPGERGERAGLTVSLSHSRDRPVLHRLERRSFPDVRPWVFDNEQAGHGRC